MPDQGEDEARLQDRPGLQIGQPVEGGTAKMIELLLRHKQDIDRHDAERSGMGRMSYDGWMVQAMEVLLRAMLEQEKRHELVREKHGCD